MVERSKWLSLRRRSAYAALCLGAGLGAVVLAVVIVFFVFGAAILNSYGKGKAERAFAEAHPGCALKLGRLAYSVRANRLVAQSVAISATGSTLRTGPISLTGVRWARLLWACPAEVLARASLDAANLEAEFPLSQYRIHCARLRASGPGSELLAQGIELRPSVGDEEFFTAHAFRATRFHLVAPECRVLGLAYLQLLQGKSYRTSSVHFDRPSFDVLVNRDQPVQPFVKSPLMVHEALAVVRQPLQIDTLSITHGHLTYRERLVAGADPGVLTFTAMNVFVEGIANRGAANAALQLRAQGDLMDAGTLKVLMTIPVTSSDFALHYSGSLGPMDLTRLNAFLEIAEHTRIKSGRAAEASFEIDVTAGHARGRVRAIYRDLEIAVLGRQTGTEAGLNNRVASFLANTLRIRNSNAPDASGSTKEGEVEYTRRPEDEFLQFAWFALRTGILAVISH